MRDTKGLGTLRRIIRKAGCRGKVSFPTYDSAIKAQGRIARKSGDVLGIYQCRFCRRFHLGHEAPHRRALEAPRSKRRHQVEPEEEDDDS